MTERFVLSMGGKSQVVSSIGQAIMIAKRDSKGSNYGVLGILTDESTPGFEYSITDKSTVEDAIKSYKSFLSYL